MDVREKLVEIVCDATQINGCIHSCRHQPCAMVRGIVDALIEKGVTVQEQDGCEYCKEDNEGYRKMIGSFSITNPFHGNVWNIETCHCKPRQIYFCPMCGRRLPQPPKGE